ncbi:MAG: hypothetical protein HDR54_01585 [Treponema sp.]|nr:hypothetical protein [Treponema sp.]MBD5400119.1 hypothetical protein [Treponema sp.]MBD5408081.1 hypothetical protein [Treponema sp.]
MKQDALMHALRGLASTKSYDKTAASHFIAKWHKKSRKKLALATSRRQVSKELSS